MIHHNPHLAKIAVLRMLEDGPAPRRTVIEDSVDYVRSQYFCVTGKRLRRSKDWLRLRSAALITTLVEEHAITQDRCTRTLTLTSSGRRLLHRLQPVSLAA